MGFLDNISSFFKNLTQEKSPEPIQLTQKERDNLRYNSHIEDHCRNENITKEEYFKIVSEIKDVKDLPYPECYNPDRLENERDLVYYYDKVRDYCEDHNITMDKYFNDLKKLDNPETAPRDFRDIPEPQLYDPTIKYSQDIMTSLKEYDSVRDYVFKDNWIRGDNYPLRDDDYFARTDPIADRIDYYEGLITHLEKNNLTLPQYEQEKSQLPVSQWPYFEKHNEHSQQPMTKVTGL